MREVDWRPGWPPGALEQRARLLALVRDFFADRDVLEVDTPVLGLTTVTDCAIDSFEVHDSVRPVGQRWYLQTSPECHMKRLLAAGSPDIYRMGPVFRRDERGPLHNPEFTMIEWYRRGFDLAALVDEVRALVDAALGGADWTFVSYCQLFQRVHGCDPDCAERSALLEAVQRATAPLPADTARSLDDSALLDFLFSDAVGQLGSGRVVIDGFPPAQAAQARLQVAADGRLVADRFEVIVDGIELANGYRELDDADELAARMDADIARRRRRDMPVPDPDLRLLAAMRHGLPDCAGVAVGFDRLLLCKLNAGSLAGVMPFTIDRS